MISQHTDLPLVTFSVKIYQVLLVAYPTKFRQEYSAEMVQVFQDCCLRTIRQSGANGMVRLWLVTLLDLVQSVISEHRQKETDMSKSQFIKLSGWALILGGIASACGLVLSNMGLNTYFRFGLPMSLRHYVWALVFWGAVGITMGMLGLWSRYGERVGNVGRNALLFGGLAGVVSLVGLLSDSLLSEEGAWSLWALGTLMSYFGLLVFGVAALRQKPLPLWNGLPILAGIWWPAYLIGAFLTDGYISNSPKPSAEMMIMAGAIMLVSMMLLGFMLQANPKAVESATTA